MYKFIELFAVNATDIVRKMSFHLFFSFVLNTCSIDWKWFRIENIKKEEKKTTIRIWRKAENPAFCNVNRSNHDEQRANVEFTEQIYWKQ